MPTLSSFFAIYTDGATPNDDFTPPEGVRVYLGEMRELTVPTRGDELFGPHASLFHRFTPKRGFLLGMTADSRLGAARFFGAVRSVLLEAAAKLEGVGLDVLRLTPFPLEKAADAVPEDLLAEDLFVVGFDERGEHGFRAETFGLAKLDQRELSFEFTGKELLEEAALLCGHLADWVLAHSRRVEPGQALAFGFDRLGFMAIEGEAGGPYRGWHPPLIQRLLPESLFPGVGVLDVLSSPEGAHGQTADLTVPLQRALEQRLVLEELDLTGDSPHYSMTAQVRGHVHGLTNLKAWREEPLSSRDSGWHFESQVAGEGPPQEGVAPLGDLARRMPAIVRYLALPPGVRLMWNEQGKLAVDSARAQHLDDAADDTEELD